MDIRNESEIKNQLINNGYELKNKYSLDLNKSSPNDKIALMENQYL